MEAEPASEPPPEMSDKMECTVLRVAFIFIFFFLYYGISCDSGMAASWITLAHSSFVLKENPTVNNTNSACRRHWLLAAGFFISFCRAIQT